MLARGSTSAILAATVSLESSTIDPSEGDPAISPYDPQIDPWFNSKVASERPDLRGLSLAEVTAVETAAGHAIRIIAEDDRVFAGTADYNGDRVNLVLRDGHVIRASMF